MNSRIPMCSALAVNVAIAAATYALRGWSVGGAHAAARNTARFSAVLFVLAFAAPGLARLIQRLPSETRLVQSFFAAHIVHFAAVTLLLALFEQQHVMHNPVRSAVVILIGFGLVATAGLTARPRNSPLHTAAHKIALYAVFLIFFLAFVGNPIVPVRVIALALVLALALRLGSGFRFYRVKTAE